MMDNCEVVLEYFRKADKPVNAGTVAQHTGVEKEVDKIMKNLKKKVRLFLLNAATGKLINKISDEPARLEVLNKD